MTAATGAFSSLGAQLDAQYRQGRPRLRAACKGFAVIQSEEHRLHLAYSDLGDSILYENTELDKRAPISICRPSLVSQILGPQLIYIHSSPKTNKHNQLDQ